MSSKKIFSREKNLFFIKMFLWTRKLQIWRPAKSSSPNVLDYFAPCPKKMENILFQKQLSFRKMFLWTYGK